MLGAARAASRTVHRTNTASDFVELPVCLVERSLEIIVTHGDKRHAGKDPGETILDGTIREEVAFPDHVVWLAEKRHTFSSSSVWRLKIIICRSPFLRFKAFPSQLFPLFNLRNLYVHVLKFLKGRQTNLSNVKDFKKSTK